MTGDLTLDDIMTRVNAGRKGSLAGQCCHGNVPLWLSVAAALQREVEWLSINLQYSLSVGNKQLKILTKINIAIDLGLEKISFVKITLI